MLINNLAFIYRTMLASVPLLEFAANLATGSLRDYYLTHAEEEAGHVEMLCADLTALGAGEIDRYHAAAQLTGSQYYLVAHDHPALLLGYMHLLESNAPNPQAVDLWEEEFDVTLTCLRHHAEHDPGHVKDIERLIAMQTPEVQSLIAWNEQNCAMLLNGVFKDMYGNRTH